MAMASGCLAVALAQPGCARFGAVQQILVYDSSALAAKLYYGSTAFRNNVLIVLAPHRSIFTCDSKSIVV